MHCTLVIIHENVLVQVIGYAKMLSVIDFLLIIILLTNVYTYVLRINADSGKDSTSYVRNCC